MPCMYACVLHCLLGSLPYTVCKSVFIRDKQQQHVSETDSFLEKSPCFFSPPLISSELAQIQKHIGKFSTNVRDNPWLLKIHQENKTTATVPLLTQIPTSYWTGLNLWLVTQVLWQVSQLRPPADRKRRAESAGSVSSLQFQIHNGTLKQLPAESDEASVLMMQNWNLEMDTQPAQNFFIWIGFSHVLLEAFGHLPP